MRFLDRPVLAVGDCHGDLPVLHALLEQEGVLSNPKAVTVVQLGDLGHFGNGSQVRDRDVYEFAEDHVDCILLGNHEAAALYPGHYFVGYEPPFAETREVVKRLQRRGRMLLAASAHGFLLTHAGLHAAFRHQNVDDGVKTDAVAFAAWVRRSSEEQDPPLDFKAIRDAISWPRGGPATAGGILWRDASEKLYGEFRQIFGHTQKDKVRTYHGKRGASYCVDVHSKYNGRLAGIWLPEERLVEVSINAASRHDKIIYLERES